MNDDKLDRLALIMETGFDTLADLIGETNARLDGTNERLDETNLRLGRLEGRFDNFLEFGGKQTRALREDVDDLKDRVTALETEKKAS